MWSELTLLQYKYKQIQSQTRNHMDVNLHVFLNAMYYLPPEGATEKKLNKNRNFNRPRAQAHLQTAYNSNCCVRSKTQLLSFLKFVLIFILDSYFYLFNF